MSSGVRGKNCKLVKSHQDLNSRTHRDLLGVMEHALHAQNVSKIGLLLISIRLLRVIVLCIVRVRSVVLRWGGRCSVSLMVVRMKVL